MDSFVKTHIAPKGVACLCGSADCAGYSSGFKLLRDSRKRFVKLPPFLEKGSSPTRNQQRECYLRYLLPNHPVEKEAPSNFIALHHFDPTIVSQCNDKIPLTLSCGQAVELRMKLSDKDKVVNENGLPCFLFCPCYPPVRVKQDLAMLAATGNSPTTPGESKVGNISCPVVQKKVLLREIEIKSWSSSVKVPTFVTVALDDDESDISSIPHEQPQDDSDKDSFGEQCNNKTTFLDLDDIALHDSEFFNAYDEIAHLQEAAASTTEKESCLHTQESFREIQKKSIQVQILLKELLGTVSGEGNNEELHVLVKQMMDAVNDIEATSSAHV